MSIVLVILFYCFAIVLFRKPDRSFLKCGFLKAGLYCTSVQKEHHFYLAVNLLYQVKCVRSRNVREALAFLPMSDTFIHNKHRLYWTVVLLFQFRYLRSQRTRAVLAFWSVSDTFISKKHYFNSTAVPHNQFINVRSQHTRAVLAFPGRFGYSYSERASLLVDFCLSLPAKIYRKPAYKSSVGFSILPVTFIHKEH